MSFVKREAEGQGEGQGEGHGAEKVENDAEGEPPVVSETRNIISRITRRSTHPRSPLTL